MPALADQAVLNDRVVPPDDDYEDDEGSAGEGQGAEREDERAGTEGTFVEGQDDKRSSEIQQASMPGSSNTIQTTEVVPQPETIANRARATDSKV